MRIELRSTPSWVPAALITVVLFTLFGVVALVGALIAMQMSDGVIALSACGALVVAMVALLMFSNFARAQQKLAYVLERGNEGMLLRNAAGEVVAQSSDGSLTMRHAVHEDYVRKQFVRRAALLIAARGATIGFVLYRGNRVLQGNPQLPSIDRKLPLATTLADAEFDALQRLAA